MDNFLLFSLLTCGSKLIKEAWEEITRAGYNGSRSFEIQTLMPRILAIDKNHGKTSFPKHEGSCIFWGTVDLCIGQHLSRLLIDILTTTSADTWSRFGRISAEYRPISRLSGVFLSLAYWSTDRPTVRQDSISSMLSALLYFGIMKWNFKKFSSVSAMYQWIGRRVSLRYQWCIGQQSASPRVGQYIGHVMFYCQTSISQQIDQQLATIASVACRQCIVQLSVIHW